MIYLYGMRQGREILAWLIVVFINSISSASMAQSVNTIAPGEHSGRIETGVPFLIAGPDARSGAMGDAGAAISPDANSAHWNPAKLGFVTGGTEISLSYSPWLKRLSSDMYLAYLSGYHRIDNRNTVGLSLKYFSVGDVELREGPDDVPGIYKPSEFAVDGTFARKFGEEFSLGSSLRFIYSNLAGGASGFGQAGTALAADVSAFYRNEMTLGGKDGLLAFGASISNIGNKISYTGEGSKLFLPANLKLGMAATIINARSELTFAFDMNKLLVPSPPERDSSGSIVRGKDPDRSVPSAIFGSFTDAAGGFSEELKEINFSLGVEYIYDHQFALRAGYFYENPDKGDRRYFTLGAGLNYMKFDFNFSYLIGNEITSPLANTLRFSLAYRIK